ncbi:MAG: hypothetical protein H0W39_08590 [Sphingomonas sp.]|nr:hypothetical protein [Sphingomonas sp.]
MPSSVVTSNDDLSRFIASSFPSVWALELLLLLKRERRIWTREELISALRASELVVSQSLESLVAGGLASLSDEGVRYLPVSDAVGRLVDRAEELYSVKPDKVRRLIVTSSGSGITAFAEAFRLRKD